MRKYLLLLILPVFILSGCAALKGLVKKPTVTFDGVSMQSMTLFDGTALFKFKIANPNPIGLSLDQLTYQLKINGKAFIKGDLRKGLRVPANGAEVVELPIAVNYMEFFNTLADLFNKDTIAYELSGSFGFGFFNIPYQQTGTFTVPKLPKITLKSAAIKNMSFTGAELLLRLEMVNENDFSVALKQLDYNVTIGGLQIAAGKANAVTSLAQMGKQDLNIPVKLNFLSLGQTAYRLLTKGSASYKLTGNMGFDIPKLGMKTTPFVKSGQVNFK